MQVRNRKPDVLWCVTNEDHDTGWIHYPSGHDLIVPSHAVPTPTTARCGAVGEFTVYAADSYDLDEDWCEECAGYVREEREFLAIIKTMDIADALKGITGVPVTIINDYIPSDSPDKV